MKKLIAMLLIAAVSQSTLARFELDQIAEDNKQILGTPNKVFFQKSCKDQLEEILDLEQKVAYMDGSESLISNYREMGRIKDDHLEHAKTHFEFLEHYRVIGMDEKSYKKLLFDANCHVQANPVRNSNANTSKP